jgi:hypothetical protein
VIVRCLIKLICIWSLFVLVQPICYNLWYGYSKYMRQETNIMVVNFGSDVTYAKYNSFA